MTHNTRFPSKWNDPANVSQHPRHKGSKIYWKNKKEKASHRALDCSQSLFYFVPHEKNITVKLAPLLLSNDKQCRGWKLGENWNGRLVNLPFSNSSTSSRKVFLPNDYCPDGAEGRVAIDKQFVKWGRVLADVPCPHLLARRTFQQTVQSGFVRKLLGQFVLSLWRVQSLQRPALRGLGGSRWGCFHRIWGDKAFWIKSKWSPLRTCEYFSFQ